MSLLLNKKELKRSAKELTVVNLRDAIEWLTEVLDSRQKEAAAIEQIKQLAKSQGYSLEQLGFHVHHELVAESATSENANKRPVKPKLKTLNKDKQYFYVESGQLQHLKTHTMKKALQNKGIEVVPFASVHKKYAKDVQSLLAAAEKQALENYNAKVEVWNTWAEANNEEILPSK
ncbi:H-NS histone family protein [Alkalimonas collagenimarina]|uniref:H-NS histone family protein n=1 Tax=Alkalimonas collagenimarina TaxID=400390 RepID=A0ABT9H327_9GAMM|nr:H-NS histone family protein [Alkalimonas collagenimarina]MDP4537723.1 H-NS histone family protein [Alkalimonas collagenimarina]